MNPILLPSLEHMAAVRLAVMLYKRNDIQDILDEIDNRHPSLTNYDYGLPYICHVPCTKDEGGWRLIQIKAKEILPDVLAPKVKVRVVEMLRPLHWELKKWLIDHDFIVPKLNVENIEILRYLIYEYKEWMVDDKFPHSMKRIKLLLYICWKSDGTIDRTRTAENFVRYEKDFLMACTYFMENDILALRPNTISNCPRNFIERFWMEWLNQKHVIPGPEKLNELFRNTNFHGYMKIRVSSFFHLLSRENRRNCFPLFHWNDAHDDDLRLCLNQMNERERTELFRIKPSCVLRCYLRWPFHNVFMEMANQMWPYISIDCFEDTLKYILSFPPGLEDINCLTIFKEFWDKSPNWYKEQMTDSEILTSVKIAEQWIRY
ncbi:hypothetical protein AVEN_152323-1 [Araneus ventricosus]|uniref:Uncharacterized protein n=1 Tax=Araneus ventricosus TaxID=182803 RepID=A0A4Y2FVP3_ARAVE|nr:hypothetical protein AVEN_152323-1 [Araneus ventricosus]